MTINISKDWMVTPDKNRCGLISLRSDVSMWSKFSRRWIRRTTVLEFHRMIQAWLGGDSGGMGFRNATEQGIFRMSPDIERKVDRVFQLKNSWAIDPDALKVLNRGPLLNAEGTTILVNSHGRFASFVNWIDHSPPKKAIGFVVFVWLIADRIAGLFG